MTPLRIVIGRALSVFRRRRLESDLDVEVRAHLDLLAADYERRGLRSTDARLAARRDFGGVEQMKETYRDRRGLPWVEDARRDVQHALRALRRACVPRRRLFFRAIEGGQRGAEAPQRRRRLEGGVGHLTWKAPFIVSGWTSQRK